MKRLEDYDSADLVWASIVYEELMHGIFSNIILVESGDWHLYLHQGNNSANRRFFEHLNRALEYGEINEVWLRREAINRFRT